MQHLILMINIKLLICNNYHKLIFLFIVEILLNIQENLNFKDLKILLENYHINIKLLLLEIMILLLISKDINSN